MCPWGKKSPTASWAALGEALVRHIWSAGSRTGHAVQERQGHTGVSPVKDHKDDKGMGTSDLQRQAERAGIVQPGEEKAQGAQSISVYKYLMGGRKTEQASSQWCPVTGQEQRKISCSVRVVEQWNRSPKDVVESPSLEMFKTCLDVALSNLL